MYSKRKLVTFVFIFFLSFLLFVRAFLSAITVEGDVDERMFEKVNYLKDLPVPLFINSGGGDSEIAYEISKIIYHKKKTIYLFGRCSSACAEFFIPAAKKVYLSKDVMIGYHHSDFLERAFEKPDIAKQFPWCAQDRIEWLEKLYDEKGLNNNFYKESITKLGISVNRFYLRNSKDGRCLTAVYKAKAYLWYPTSHQMSTYLHFKSEHQICADNRYCWERNLKKYSSEDIDYVIGDMNYYYGS